jgi:hypothetical protein
MSLNDPNWMNMLQQKIAQANVERNALVGSGNY